MKNFQFYICFTLILFASIVSQENQLDTTKVKKTNSGFVSKIAYAAEAVKYTKDDKGQPITIYTGNAQISYEDMKINAYEIVVYQNESRLYATPKRDTTENGKEVLSQIPEFNQVGSDPMYGEEMGYHFLTKRGSVINGKTEIKSENAKYEGEEIKKIGQKTILIRDGKFTTCDSDSPSYWFHSSKIRMVKDDMLYTGPIIMKIQEIPFPIILPVGVFSLKRGKRSGVELPSYQGDSQYGRGLTELGYYWAASDYFQARFLTDYYENSGFVNMKLFTEYKTRYDLNGYVNLKYTPKNPLTLKREDNFSVDFKHSHKIDPSMNINGGGQFSSRVETNARSININNAAQQKLRMDMSLSKSWDNGNSLNLSTSYDQDLLTKAKQLNAPTLTFSMRTRPLFGEAKDPSNKKWYESIQFNYSNNFRYNWEAKSEQDSLGNYSVSDENSSVGAQHTISLSAPIKLFKYFTLSPSVNYSEKWTIKQPEIDEAFQDSLVLKEVTKFGALRTFSIGAGLNTKLYGFFQPNIFGMKILRHQMTPSVSFSYSPDFTTEAWGYLKNVNQFSKFNPADVRQINGENYIDRFKFSSYGGTPLGESLRASISLGNNFSAKFKGENGEDIKRDLFSINTNTSIDFLKDSLRWSNLSSNFNIPTSNLFTFSGSFTHSFYKQTKDGRDQNEFSTLPVFKSLTVRSSVNLSSKLFTQQSSDNSTDSDKSETNSDTENITNENESSLDTDKDKLIKDLKTFDIPWNYSLNLSYTFNRFSTIKHNFSTNMTLGLTLTKNWKVNYNNSLNVQDWELISQRLTVARNLDCWTMSFTYSPNKFNTYFLLTLQIKEDMLKDLKYERNSRNLPIN